MSLNSAGENSIEMIGLSRGSMYNEMFSMSRRSIKKKDKDSAKHKITYILVHFLNQSLIICLNIDTNSI